MKRKQRRVEHHILKNSSLIKARYSQYSSSFFTPHTHNTYSLAVILEGSSTIQIGNRTITGRKGDSVIIHPNEIHSCNPSGTSLWAYYMFYINQKWFTNCLREKSSFSNKEILSFTVPVVRDTTLFTMLSSLYKTVRHGTSDGVKTSLSSIATRLLALGIHEIKGAPPAFRSCTREVINYIHTNYSWNIPLQSLAEAAGMSPYHLLRIFKEETGFPPHAYQQRYRIDRAKELLHGGTRAVDTAMECGFSDQSHFIRTFKSYVGCTPAEYLKNFTVH